MNSLYPPVSRFAKQLAKRIKELSETLSEVEQNAKLKWPEDLYGFRWMRTVERTRQKIIDELNLCSEYSKALDSAIYIVEVERLHLQEDGND